MKRSFKYRYRSSGLDFRCDGMFEKDRIKDKDKKNLRKLTKRMIDKWLAME